LCAGPPSPSQASKLRMGANHSILLFYKSHLVLQFADESLLVTLVVSPILVGFFGHFLLIHIGWHKCMLPIYFLPDLFF